MCMYIYSTYIHVSPPAARYLCMVSITFLSYRLIYLEYASSTFHDMYTFLVTSLITMQVDMYVTLAVLSLTFMLLVVFLFTPVFFSFLATAVRAWQLPFISFVPTFVTCQVCELTHSGQLFLVFTNLWTSTLLGRIFVRRRFHCFAFKLSHRRLQKRGTLFNPFSHNFVPF